MDKGHHTWDLYVHYLRCPHCGFILETRQRANHFTCPRCSKEFDVKSKTKSALGPFLDDKNQTSEMDWS